MSVKMKLVREVRQVSNGKVMFDWKLYYDETAYIGLRFVSNDDGEIELHSSNYVYFASYVYTYLTKDEIKAAFGSIKCAYNPHYVPAKRYAVTAVTSCVRDYVENGISRVLRKSDINFWLKREYVIDYSFDAGLC